MKADFSRLRAPSELLDEWLQQQGRVWLDSDWNEAALARLHQLESRIADLVGARGRPEPGTGFRLGTSSGGRVGDFAIGGGRGAAGHAYVDGVLAANPTPTSYFTQPQYPQPPALPLPSVAATGWDLVGDLQAARGGHAAAVVRLAARASRGALVCGGSKAGAVTAAAERYDPLTTTWSPAASMQAARIGHTATALADGRVLVTGGTGGSAGGGAGLALASAELYDPAADRWTATGSMGAARSLHTATLLPDGRVLVCGGFGPRGGSLPSIPSTNGAQDALSTAEVYSPSTGQWLPVAPMTSARADHRAVLVPSVAGTGAAGGDVLVAGGQDGGAALAAAERYNPTTNQWVTVAPMAAAREAHTLTALADGRILAVGGTAGGLVLAGCELFQPADGTWHPAAALAGPRANHTAAAITGNQVLVAGGYALGRPLASAELYDPGRDDWRAARPLNEARSAHSATVLDDGSVLVAGGTDLPGEPPALPAQGSTGEIPTAERYVPAAMSSALAYLEVWRRLVTYLQDDQREPALGGPDTTARARTVAQVKILEIPASHQPDGLDCAHAAAYLPDDGAGRLSTLTAEADPPADPCAMSDAGVFAGAENLLYRVEIHDSGQMLGAVAPADLPLTADAAAGAMTLRVGPLVGPQAAALALGRWELVVGGYREALDIRYADTSGAVTLAAGLRVAATVASGARLVRHRATVPLTAAAAAGTRTLHVDPATGAVLTTQAHGAISAPSWFLRSGSTAEALTIVSYDTSAGTIGLGDGLAHSYPAGAGVVGRARFTWSADNAGFATAVTGVVSSDLTGGTTTVQVASLGRDNLSRLHAGDLVELVGDTADLGAGVGLLAHITAEPDPDALTVSVDVADPGITPALAQAVIADHLVLRRWDGVAFVGPDPVDLGQGVQVQFSGSDFVATSYWWFTARAQTGTVEALTAAAPNGIERHRMPLALLRWRGDEDTGVTLERITDCVPVFDPLTALQADHIGYDDQITQLGATTVQQAIEALAPRPQPVNVASVSWSNDRPLPYLDFQAGLTVQFGEPMHPATITADTFRVRVSLPDDATGLMRVLDVPGTVSHELGPVGERLGGRLIRPAGGGRPNTFAQGVVAATFHPAVAFPTPARGARVEVLLDGDKMLDWTGTRSLDGNAFGRVGHDAYSTFVGLRLPSGDGRGGGTFESWFFVSADPRPVRIASAHPASGSTVHVPPGSLPSAQVMFTKDVTASVLEPGAVTLSAGDQPLGVRVDPYPFDPGATAMSGITITAQGGGPAVPGPYTLALRSSVIRDVDGLPLDGTGNGSASDFVSTFTVAVP